MTKSEMFPRSAIVTEVTGHGFTVTVYLRSSPDSQLLLADEPVETAHEATLMIARQAVAQGVATDAVDVRYDLDTDAAGERTHWSPTTGRARELWIVWDGDAAV
jgi:hypothetical protein